MYFFKLCILKSNSILNWSIHYKPYFDLVTVVPKTWVPGNCMSYFFWSSYMTFESLNSFTCRYLDFWKSGILDKLRLEVLLFLVFSWVLEAWYIVGNHTELIKICLPPSLPRFARCPFNVWVEQGFTYLVFWILEKV